MSARADQTPRDFFEEFQAGAIAPVYLFVGTESLLIDRGIRLLKEEFLRRPMADLNLVVTGVKDQPLGTLIDTCMTAPAFSPRRLIIVRDALPPLKDAEAAWTRYVADPAPTTTLVLAGDKIDGRSKLLTAARETGRVVRFMPPEPRELAAWALKEAKRAGLALESAAATQLVELIGPNLSLLAGEIEKLRLLVGPKGRATAADVDALAADVKTSGVFDLVRAIEQRDAPSVLFHWKKLSGGRSGVPFAVGVLASQFRQIWQARVMLDHGAREDEIGAGLGKSGWALKKTLEQARRWRREDLETTSERLLEVDIASKSTRVPAEIHMDALLLELATPKAGSGRSAGRPR